MRISLAAMIGAGLLAALAGCANHTTELVSPEPMTPPQQNFELVWQSSIDVLEGYFFTIDRQDRRQGVITTYPMTGRHWFEFWRHDAVTRFDVAEGTLQTIYRAVQVDVKPTDEDHDRFRAVVTTRILRSDRPSREPISAMRLHGPFYSANSSRITEHAMREYEQTEDPNAMVTPLGRDRKLEERISAQIAAKVAGRQVAGAK